MGLSRDKLVPAKNTAGSGKSGLPAKSTPTCDIIGQLLKCLIQEEHNGVQAAVHEHGLNLLCGGQLHMGARRPAQNAHVIPVLGENLPQLECIDWLVRLPDRHMAALLQCECMLW